jgi:hypothetical protein
MQRLLCQMLFSSCSYSHHWCGGGEYHEVQKYLLCKHNFEGEDEQTEHSLERMQDQKFFDKITCARQR